jgi:hypothetical protein
MATVVTNRLDVLKLLAGHAEKSGALIHRIAGIDAQLFESSLYQNGDWRKLGKL